MEIHPCIESCYPAPTGDAGAALTTLGRLRHGIFVS
jgi:hypothetical protein